MATFAHYDWWTKLDVGPIGLCLVRDGLLLSCDFLSCECECVSSRGERGRCAADTVVPAFLHYDRWDKLDAGPTRRWVGLILFVSLSLSGVRQRNILFIVSRDQDIANHSWDSKGYATYVVPYAS